MKQCTKCGERKPRSEFYAAKGTRDGLRGDCKVCFAARAKRWYALNRERVITRVREWQQANPERHSAKQREIRARRRPAARDQHLRRNFGIGTPEYEQLLAAQGGRCAICERGPRKGSSLHVDHDHETGDVRGLLCFRCNGGLGQFAEDSDRLIDAAEYLDGALEAGSTRRLLRAISVARAKSLVSSPG